MAYGLEGPWFFSPPSSSKLSCKASSKSLTDSSIELKTPPNTSSGLTSVSSVLSVSGLYGCIPAKELKDRKNKVIKKYYILYFYKQYRLKIPQLIRE